MTKSSNSRMEPFDRAKRPEKILSSSHQHKGENFVFAGVDRARIARISGALQYALVAAR